MVTRECSDPWRPWFACEAVDGLGNSAAGARVQLPEGAACTGPDFYAVGRHREARYREQW